MLISIIIPVYKVECFLEECIDSVLAQSYGNIEIILVNDGSPDKCPQICDRYKSLHDNIKVIHKQNGGLSSARNAGLEIASGEYIIFLDSDDVLVKTGVQTVVDCLSTKPDVLITEMFNTRDVKEYREGDTFAIPAGNKKEDAIRFVFSKEELTWPAQQYIVSRSFIVRNQLRFEEGYYHEDVDWTTTLFSRAESFAYCNKVWYIRRFAREGSITSVPNPKRTMDMIKLVSCQINDKSANSFRAEDREIVFNQLIRALLSSLIYYSEYDQQDKRKIDELLDSNKRILFWGKAKRHKMFAVMVNVLGTGKAMKLYHLLKR